MPRAPWRRRHLVDSPRPAGRRWTGRLRRGSSLARRALLVRVVRRPRGGTATTVIHQRPRRDVIVPAPLSFEPPAAARPAVPVSPAPPPVGPAPAEPVAAAVATVALLPGERTVARRIKFALVNACTLASLALGISAIFLAMRDDVRLAAVGLIACVVFDGLDGALARRLGVASPFGAQMDSLADMASFGLAAPVVVYASLAGSVHPAAAGVACALVAGSAAVRLARFNVSPKDGRFFTGVPTTMAAAVLAVGVLIGVPLAAGLQLVGVAVLAFAMVSSFPYAKLARLIKLPPWLWLLPLVGALIDVRLTFALAVLAYLASGPLLWIRRRTATV